MNRAAGRNNSPLSSARWRGLESDSAQCARRSRGVGLVALLLFTVALMTPVIALADETPQSTVVVQNRKHTGTHEFGLGVGVLPLDAFTKGLTVSGSYSLHFSDLVGWEVAQFFYSFHMDTGLREELDAFELRPTPFEVVNYYLSSNFIWKPLYWKGSWLNSSLMYGEFFVLAGGGYGWLTRSARPLVDLGLGFRFYTGEHLSFRLDARYLWFFGGDSLSDLDAKDEIWLGVGGGFSL